MQTTLRSEASGSLEKLCDPTRPALLVYDMRGGIGG